MTDLTDRVRDVMPQVRRDLEDLVRIESVWSDPDRRAEVVRSAEKVAGLLREAGFGHVEIVSEGGAPAVIAHHPAPPGAPTVLLYAHHDVQPEGDAAQWDSAPFEPTERDGRLYGRGAADDKAGIAIIMTAAARLLSDKTIAHGPIRICFNPDEEIGHGVDHLDIAQLGAVAAYTFDGGAVGEVSWETFSADGAVVEITGVSTHPGTAHAYGMVNAVHLAGKLLGMLPREFAAPESTTGRVGFIHPTSIEGSTASATVRFIIRDHDNEKLAAKGGMLRLICAALQAVALLFAVLHFRRSPGSAARPAPAA